MSDNNVGNTEVILPIPYDATQSQNYGGTTFLICSAHTADPTDNKSFGIPGGGWLGNRSTKNLPSLFPDYTGTIDKRSMFGGSTPDIADVLTFTEGLEVFKFTNVASNGTTPYSPNGVLCSTDFPLFRLAEMYLVYAEAEKRGGTGGSDAIALQYLNLVRARGYENSNGALTSFALSDVLDERARELYWEGFRRTDLIRYGKFTDGSYLWPWKAGVQAGAGTDAHYGLFPIPASEIISNTNLTQNTGY
jgi:hypothetical protein